MDYLVSMTTRVPDGTSDAAVDEVRTREAARSRQLAAQGHLLRLWRPPLQPGEWRTLGLFAAEDDARLEAVLASMPLRVWRTDEVTPLLPHPDDPCPDAGKRGSPAPDGGGSEYLVTTTLTVPADTPAETVDATRQREADRARALAEEGHLRRLWMPPGRRRELGLWRAPDDAGVRSMLESLPLYPWMAAQTTPLTPHPSDPAIANR
jgi:muconolactone delta-isomerase